MVTLYTSFKAMLIQSIKCVCSVETCFYQVVWIKLLNFGIFTKVNS